ncbi:alpha-amylase family protein [Phytoactinopolyspora halotolerans]|uniref:Beta-galactosidase trimerisation domain-containing protein n=1 Tax=Phytoactinopolyspora halotolerans TaxID=1981512 RepID=A0A6L9SBG7_9ACTN|nr:alpha-amylase family protein [Phytoactinopolyspora halotolerans]NEE01984.1 hypothetical protein [Phytoactinopolyspora halotolerans]
MTRESTSSTLAAHAYQQGWRRMLVDMEIPSWDPAFLREFDPASMADLYKRAGLSSVMFSCKAMTGLSFWPTEVGRKHPGIGRRDVVAETLSALRERGIATCAYTSMVFDSWAAENRPDWRTRIVEAPRSPSPWDRHASCCPNNPGYREYVIAQVTELFSNYDVDCGFCDMSFWPGVCVCQHCRDRYQNETGREIPRTIDWLSTEWCCFQAARERWIIEFQHLVADAAQEARPGMPFYHNFATALFDWTFAVPFAVTEASAFLGGDLYGDQIEQLMVIKLMRNLSKSRPVEFMAFCTNSAGEHVQLKYEEHMRMQALTAAAESTAMTFIDAIDPIGTANPGTYDRVAKIFSGLSKYDQFLGGEALEDVGVYMSSDSKTDFDENGMSLSDRSFSMIKQSPHFRAVRGACRALQRGHIPFGVVTRQRLDELDKFKVTVLPNVERMDAVEIDALRAYVHNGGHLYASKYTSLVDTSGFAFANFSLSDLFGIELLSEDETGMVYARPATDEARSWVSPQRYLGVDPSESSLSGGLLWLKEDDSSTVLAHLTLPYAHPKIGNAEDRQWSSMHSFPPYSDTDALVIVKNQAGLGTVIYSAFDVETDEAEINDRMFAGIVQSLLVRERSFWCEAHPSVSVSAFHHVDDSMIRLVLLNSRARHVGRTRLGVTCPYGASFVSLQELPSRGDIPFEIHSDGSLECTLQDFSEIVMIAATYAEDSTS